MDRAKITLSEQEHRLVMDPSVILMKNRVIQKVYELFGECSRDCQAIFTLPPEVAVIQPKIARGESYKGLPYVMLDYPRYFTPKDVLAIRTFFWWGNYVSVTLHLKGRFMSLYHRAILNHLEKLATEGYHLSQTEDEWDHDLDGGGYQALDQLSFEQVEARLLNESFFKLTRSFSLETWDLLPEQLRKAHEMLGDLTDLKGE